MLLRLKPWEVIVCKNGHPCYISTRNVGTEPSNHETWGLVAFDGVSVDDNCCPKCKAKVFRGHFWVQSMKNGRKEHHSRGNGNYIDSETGECGYHGYLS